MKISDIELANTELIKIEVGTESFNIKPYISMSEKYDLVMDTLEQSKEPNNFYNEIKLDMFLHLNLIYYYTDIEITEEEKQNPYELYDILELNGIITTVIENIENEYKIILDYLMKSQNKMMMFDNSIAGAFKELVNMLPDGAAAMKEIMDNFDPEKYSNIVNLASAIGINN